LLTATTISGQRHLSKTEARNIFNIIMKSLKIGIQRMWDVNRDTSNNTGNGNDLSITQKIPQQPTGKHVINELQKIVILGTANILRKVLT
jgi:hypothetical protein